MVHVHASVLAASARFGAELRRHNHVTPSHYLDFLRTYRGQLAAHRRRITTRLSRLEGGLSKLADAVTDVDKLSGEVRAQKVVVDAKTADVQALIADIGSRQGVADRAKAEASAKAAELETTGAVIAQESARANTALEAALPALEAAAAALDNLNKDDITEIKAFASPPPLVMAVCMCVLHLRPTGRESEADGWKGAKAMMSDAGFLKSLKAYDKDKITDKVRKGRGRG
jgi:dynein heavy chain